MSILESDKVELHSIYIKATSGYSNKEVGKLTNAHRNSINEWTRVYLQYRFNELIKVNHGTNKSLLETIQIILVMHLLKILDEV